MNYPNSPALGQEETLPNGVVMRWDGEKWKALSSSDNRLRIYSVESIPSAVTSDRNLVYVTDGNSGTPCLAFAEGGTWKRINLGAVISSS